MQELLKQLDKPFSSFGNNANRSREMSLKEQIAEYRAGWYQRVLAERHAIMQRHMASCEAAPSSHHAESR